MPDGTFPFPSLGASEVAVGEIEVPWTMRPRKSPPQKGLPQRGIIPSSANFSALHCFSKTKTNILVAPVENLLASWRLRSLIFRAKSRNKPVLQ